MTITSMSQENRKLPPPKEFTDNAHIKGIDMYNKIYKDSIHNPESFWEAQAKQLHWFKKWDSVFDWDKDNVKFTWFKGGKTNVSYNCLDKNLEKNADKVAIIWQGEPDEDVRKITFKELHTEVCKF